MEQVKYFLENEKEEEDRAWNISAHKKNAIIREIFCDQELIHYPLLSKFEPITHYDCHKKNLESLVVHL